MKKQDLPAMPWYWGDWFKCPEVRALTPAARCLWFEMLGLMWESTPKGYLILGGKPYPKEALARCLGFALDLLERLLAEMEQYSVYSKTETNIIYSRRMVRDVEISKIRAEAGRKGGICSSFAKGFGKANFKQNTEDENEIEIEDETVSESGSEGDHKGVELNPRKREPTKEEIIEYSNNIGYPELDPEAFLAHYRTNGWVQGKGGKPIKDWQACVVTWKKNDKNHIDRKEGKPKDQKTTEQELVDQFIPKELQNK
jgi:hypothetical protein